MDMPIKVSPVRKQFLVGGDAIAALVILVLSLKRSQAFLTGNYADLWVTGFVPLLIFSSYLCDVYDVRPWRVRTLVVRSFVAAGISVVVLFLLGKFAVIPFPLIYGLLPFVVFQLLWQSVLEAVSKSSVLSKNVLIIGTGPAALEVGRLIEGSPGKYVLSGYIATPMDPVSVEKNKIVGNMDDVVPLCRQHQTHLIVMAITERRGLAIDKLISCKLMGVRIVDYPSFYEAMTGKIPVESINPSWLVQSKGFLITPYICAIKRMFDIVLSSLTLLLTLPIFLVVMVLVKLTSTGPVFYFQKRVGKDNKEFTIYKFRTMVTDAEAKGEAIWAKENDPRVTRFGYLLRKVRFDELPQLVNVLKGEMSFIGPRPERREFVEKICKVTPYYLERHAVKPGITGWAQVKYPYGASLGDSVEKLRYDLYYINNLSVSLDVSIIFKTIKVILFGKGSR
jgi:sugar transferase (PEP-CTERM system associated)